MAFAIAVVLAVAFWIWSAFIAVGAGLFGAALNSGCHDGCEDGFPSVLEPWAWGDHYVSPEVAYVAFAGLVAASCFAAFVSRAGERLRGSA